MLNEQEQLSSTPRESHRWWIIGEASIRLLKKTVADGTSWSRVLPRLPARNYLLKFIQESTRLASVDSPHPSAGSVLVAAGA